jgi:hypothetical protein
MSCSITSTQKGRAGSPRWERPGYPNSYGIIPGDLKLYCDLNPPDTNLEWGFVSYFNIDPVLNN